MSNDNNEEALSLIKEINELHMELSYALEMMNNVANEINWEYWLDQEVILRKRIKRAELALTILNRN